VTKKTKVTFGLVALILLLLLTLVRGPGSGPDLPSAGNPAVTEWQPDSEAEPTRHVGSPALLPTSRVLSRYASLFAVVETEADSDERNEALESAVESVSETDLPTLLDALALDTRPGAEEMRLRLIRRWAESDSAAAATWTAELPENRVRGAAFEQVAIAWANTDPAAAVSWVQALPESDSKSAATFALAYEAARTEPILALDLASALPPSPERDDLLAHAVSQWAATDATAAGNWAIEMPDPALRGRLVAAVAVAMAEDDGVAAGTLAANALNAGEEQDRTTVSIVQRWTQNSPQAAAEWVAQFPDIPLRMVAMENLLALWSNQDASAVGDWLRELPAGSLRNFGMTAFAQSLAEQPQATVPVVPAGGI